MDLREQCLEMGGGGDNAFWKVCMVGRTLSLISIKPCHRIASPPSRT